MSILVPSDSDFILLRGRMAQETRRRRMSEPAIPSSMSTAASQSDRTSERRRNTLDATISTAGLISPPTSPEPSVSNSQMLTAMMLKNKQRVAPLLVGKMATILPPQAQQKAKWTACDQQETSSGPLASPIMSPSAEQLRRYHAADTVSPSLACIPEGTFSSDAAGSADQQQVTPSRTATAQAVLSSEQRDHHNGLVNLIVLDNKKIRLARPRIIRIKSSGKQ
ncbi:hypothetical protein J3B02_006136 [Coemansia erecta]|uniref:Uncharacterized protein n=1 Tax=Coemansia asiatica TaxID=1052880 RepID=A0A9W7XNT4_9FUNG|nr:hypothetical protein LPJ64_002388 [Coemansia asiatica]KAJ2840940.1 hypothetical protein J3B02_006136 [Coemansia erecta]